jgi:hypothetical protein|nr:MAG TPA: hypothetical protein [Caudoviricetes sp.]
MIKIKLNDEKYKENGPDLYEIYFKNYSHIGRNSMIYFLAKTTHSKDSMVGDLISNKERLMVLIKDRIDSDQRKRF